MSGVDRHQEDQPAGAIAFLDYARGQQQQAAERARSTTHPWAAYRLELLARRTSGAVPTYGSDSWEQLGDCDPRKYAALIEAAEQWRRRSPQPPAEQRTYAGTSAAYARAALAGEVQHVLDALPDSHRRHQVLLRAAQSLGTLIGAGLLDEQLARTALTDAAEINGGDPSRTYAAIAKDIDDGITWGMARPRRVSA